MTENVLEIFNGKSAGAKPQAGGVAASHGYQTLRWHTENRVGWLRIGQPPSNQMTIQFFREFSDWVDSVSDDAGLKAIIIHGNGRHFSSGADLSELLANLSNESMLENYRCFQKLEKMNVPVISAIGGVCLGSAFELALFSHFRICSDDAVIGLPETSFNLMPGIGGIGRMVTLAGKARALELILRGMTLPATEAGNLNMVDAVVPKRELKDIALTLAISLPEPFHVEFRQVYIEKYLRRKKQVQD